MRVCIVGAGKVGYYLARTLLEDGIEVVLIEKDAVSAQECADRLDIRVIQADGTSLPALRQANCNDCDALVAVTGQDENNLVTCQLAKSVFHVPKTAARVNNPKNEAILQKLGVDIVVSGTTLLALQLERLVENEGVKQLAILAEGQASLFELLLPPHFPLAGRTLAEIKMPKNFTVVSITRVAELLYPHGDTQLFPGDRVVCLSSSDVLQPLCEVWGLSTHKPLQTGKKS